MFRLTTSSRRHRAERARATFTAVCTMSAALCGPLCGPLCSMGRADTLDRALSLVPADAESAIVVPSLKKASDELMLCIERSERVEVLVGGRPLDLLKARAGVTVGVRDEGSLVMLQRAPRVDTDPTLAVVLVPVSDPAIFLEGNFKPAEDGTGRFIGPSGALLYARPIGDHVALSTIAAGLEGLDASADAAAAFRARLGPAAADLLPRGDLLVWLSGAAARRAVSEASAQVDKAGDHAEGEARDERLAEMRRRQQATVHAIRDWSEGLDNALVAIDCDALGIFSRGILTSVAGSRLATTLAGGPASMKGPLSRLPNQPFYLALGIDVAGLGGWSALDQLLEGSPLAAQAEAATPAWVRAANALQFGVYPSKLGVAVGGVLNDASLVLFSADPSTLLRGFRDTLMARAGDHEGVRYDPTWEKDRALKSGETVDAFELRTTVLPGAPVSDETAINRMTQSILFGNRGFHGFARTVPDALIVTFSQRPDVLSRATDAVTGAGAGLAEDVIVAAMRGFMLEQSDVELFIGVGQLGRLLKQLSGLVPGGATGVPEIDPATEPIGVSIAVGDGSMRSAGVVPASVVGLVIDQARRSVMAAPAESGVGARNDAGADGGAGGDR